VVLSKLLKTTGYRRESISTTSENQAEERIRELARAHRVSASRSAIDDWIDRSSALAGQDGLPADETQQILANLIRSNVLDPGEAFDLHVSYLGPGRLGQRSFDPFGDFESEGYLRNFPKFKDGKQLSDHERLACASFASAAASHLKKSRRIGYSDVLAVHEVLFKHVFPWAGQDRLATAPQLLISKAGLGNIFALPGHEKRAMDYALQLAADPTIMRSKPGEIMGHMAHAHPFLDGNGRAFMLVHNELCRRAGLHVNWFDVGSGEYLRALTLELQDPGKGILDRFLKPYLVMKPLDLTSSTS
jgi:cell filamentation protein